MLRVRQSTQGLWRLPACAAVLVTAFAASAPAQEYRVTREENLRRDSSATANVLARVNPGTRLRGASASGPWREVTLEGWIWSQSVRETSRDGFDVSVAPQEGENLRDAPSGNVLARVATGMLFDELERQGNWVRVRRTAWMWAASLEPVTREAAAAAPERPATARATDGGGAVGGEEPSLGHALAADTVPMRLVPEGPVSATLAAEAPVRVLARSGEWVRVQTEGWVRETDLRPGAPDVLVGVSGAEVRSRPQAFEGKVLQWTVQFIAVQRADEVRYDIPAGRRYLLVRGPLPESGFAYVLVTQEQLEQAEKFEPLTDLVMLARVRVGRSRYLGNPVLELIEMAVR